MPTKHCPKCKARVPAWALAASSVGAPYSCTGCRQPLAVSAVWRHGVLAAGSLAILLSAALGMRFRSSLAYLFVAAVLGPVLLIVSRSAVPQVLTTSRAESLAAYLGLIIFIGLVILLSRHVA